MEMLDDNAQQVPEGFYLEVCNQLKTLHGAVRPELDAQWCVLDEAERMLNRKAEKLKDDQDHLNYRVLNYNKRATAYLEKVKEYKVWQAQLRKKGDNLKAREARVDEREDNITLAQLQRQLILTE